MQQEPGGGRIHWRQRGSMEEAEAKGGSEESKTSNKNGGAKATQGARNDVQKSMETEPIRLSDRTPANHAA